MKRLGIIMILSILSLGGMAQEKEFESCPLETIEKGWKTKTITNVINGSLGVMLERFDQTWPTWMGGMVRNTMEKGLEKEVIDKETELTVTIDAKNGYVEVSDGGTDGEYMSACVWNRTNGHKLLAICMGDPTDPFIEFICFYDYNPQTKSMTPEPDILRFKKWTPQYPYFCTLPREGKNLILREWGKDGLVRHTFTWDGMKPVLSKSDAIDDPEDEDDANGQLVVFKGSQPTIVDFVNHQLSQKDIGEPFGEMKEMWKLYQQGKQLPKGRSFIVDVKNGYVRYDAKYSDKEWQFTEFCVWNYSDKRRKLVAYNNERYKDGKPVVGQYTGLEFSIYNGRTHKMKPSYLGEVGIKYAIPDGLEAITHTLPRTGKTLVYTFHTKTGKSQLSMTWNGSEFEQDK